MISSWPTAGKLSESFLSQNGLRKTELHRLVILSVLFYSYFLGPGLVVVPYARGHVCILSLGCGVRHIVLPLNKSSIIHPRPHIPGIWGRWRCGSA